MLTQGIYPAAITPFDPQGRVDMPSMARLLAWFESAGCKGAVLAGTNGEGPSLSAVEKRDLVRNAMPLRGNLELVLGIATCSADEAIWLCKQAHKDGAAAALLMPPFYFRDAPEVGILRWFEEVLTGSPLPILIYNFPQRTGVTIRPEMLAQLSMHEKFLGAKDSSGEAENLQSYRQAVGDKLLYVGNETLLWPALEAGWSGSISGAANTCPHWLSTIVAHWCSGDLETGETKFRVLLPLLEKIRKAPQPATHKALLCRHGVLGCAVPRLPLVGVGQEEIEALAAAFESIIGFKFERG